MLLHVAVEEGPEAVRVALAGELDIASAVGLEEQLATVERSRPPLIVIDLRRLEFMDSTGLRLIIGADSRAREQGRRLQLIRGNEAVHRVFHVTRLDERLDIVEASGAAPD